MPYRYTIHMIEGFRHKGLQLLYEIGDSRRLQQEQVTRIRRVLTVLDRVTKPQDANMPGYRLHPLKGDRKGVWSVWISGNWRITFRVENGNVRDVDLVDYH